MNFEKYKTNEEQIKDETFSTSSSFDDLDEGIFSHPSRYLTSLDDRKDI